MVFLNNVYCFLLLLVGLRGKSIGVIVNFVIRYIFSCNYLRVLYLLVIYVYYLFGVLGFLDLF